MPEQRRSISVGASKKSPTNPKIKKPIKKSKMKLKYADILCYLREFRLLKCKKEVDFLLKEILEIHHSYKKGVKK